MMNNTYDRPHVGSTVRMGDPVGNEDSRALKAGRTYRIDRYTQPHGYAVILELESPGRTWYVHPESLQVVAEP